MVANVAQPLSFDPGAEPVTARSAISRTANPPEQSVARVSPVTGTTRWAQRKVSSKAQKAKTMVANVAQPLSFDPGAEPVMARSAISRTANPPDQSVARASPVRGRSIRITQATTVPNAGSLITIFSRGLPRLTDQFIAWFGAYASRDLAHP